MQQSLIIMTQTLYTECPEQDPCPTCPTDSDPPTTLPGMTWHVHSLTDTQYENL